MKKWFAVLLTILLAIMPVAAGSAMAEAAADDNGAIEFTNDIVDALDWSASKWFSTEYNRAMFSILTSFALSSAVEDLDAAEFMSSNSSYVGKSGDFLVLAGHVGNKEVFVYYSPTLKRSMYTITEVTLSDSLIDTVIETVLAEMDDGYYKNSPSSILECAKDLQEIMNS